MQQICFPAFISRMMAIAAGLRAELSAQQQGIDTRPLEAAQELAPDIELLITIVRKAMTRKSEPSQYRYRPFAQLENNAALERSRLCLGDAPATKWL